MAINKLKINPLKALVLLLEFLAFGLIVYLIVLPFYPDVRYKIRQMQGTLPAADTVEQVAAYSAGFPVADYAVSPNRLIIAKIGVNAPIVESPSAEVGLNRGAWRMPDSSTPDKGGNTVITGHRFKYLPPNNLTFYLFDKLAAGDIVLAKWEGKDYYYRIRETKVVPATEMSVLNQTKEPILTMFTCDPIYSTENRLVVVADLMPDGAN